MAQLVFIDSTYDHLKFAFCNNSNQKDGLKKGQI